MTTQLLTQANLFELEGDNTQITYSTTSFTGVPQLTYTHQGQVLSFKGPEILAEQTQLGYMVTVNLNEGNGTVMSLKSFNKGFVSLSLLIPSINLLSQQTSIQTLAILSQRSRIKPGQAQTYTTIYLSGRAQQVLF